MAAYYNEIDPKAAAWLRELIKAGAIAPGEVDERDIRDIHPSELRRFDQCHFFAGIGVWSYALRSAGWPDDRRVWTGSCPCQPFSAAGKRAGTADERHLWPHWFQLIEQCRPSVVFGEQVASPDGLRWLDLVHDDLEGADYAVGAFDLCAAGVGAPHIRQRLWFVAESRRERLEGEPRSAGVEAGRNGEARRLAESDSGECDGISDGEGREPDGATTGRIEGDGCFAGDRGAVLVVHADDAGSQGWSERRLRADQCPFGEAGVVGGFWRDADWIYCRDEKWRPVESGAFPLAHGAPARVGRLRGYGNAIVAPVAAAFIAAYAEST